MFNVYHIRNHDSSLCHVVRICIVLKRLFESSRLIFENILTILVDEILLGLIELQNANEQKWLYLISPVYLA